MSFPTQVIDIAEACISAGETSQTLFCQGKTLISPALVIYHTYMYSYTAVMRDHHDLGTRPVKGVHTRTDPSKVAKELI